MGAKRGKKKKKNTKTHAHNSAPSAGLNKREEISEELNRKYPDTTEKEYGEEKKMTLGQKAWEWAKRDTTLTNLTVAVSTIVIAAVGFLQWSAIDGQLQAMIEADRPWVGGIIMSSDSIEKGKVGIAKLTVINSGRSPARIIKFQAAQNVFPSLPNDPPYTNSTRWNELSHTLLLPNMPATNEFPVTAVDPTVFQLIIDNKVKLYIYGRVEYEDLRVKNSEHVTTMCFFWAVGQQTPFVTCPEYNEAN